MFNHPEVSQYGLELDCNLWQEFNKELAIRSIMKQELPQSIDNYIMDSDELVAIDFDCYHLEVSNTIETLKQKGLLSFNYEVIG